MKGTIVTNGDLALTVVLGTDIDIRISKMVRLLRQTIEKENITGIVELVPAYCTLMVHYRPELILFDALKDRLISIMERLDETDAEKDEEERVLVIPVYYADVQDTDFTDVAEFHHISKEELVRRHTEKENYTYMLGAHPGMGYLVADNGLQMPRHANPRAKIHEGDVIVFRNQSIVMAMDYPSGWYVIGRTPVRAFMMEKEEPFLMKAGQWVKFESITKYEFEKIEKEVEEGRYVQRFYEKKGTA